jgi:predicted O-methyltransferase YrrM
MEGSYFGKFIRKVASLASLADYYVNSQSEDVGQTPEAILEFAYRHYPNKPNQIRSEMLRFARLVHKWRPKTLVEIGTHTGGTFFVLCRCADPDAMVISLDLPGARFSGSYPRLIKHLLPRAPLSTQTLKILRADSHQRDSANWLEATLHGGSVDVMLIDGDHTYAGVKQDFEMYSAFVRKGGIVAFHDIVKHPAETGCDVESYWEQVKLRHEHQEFIEDPKQGWGGIGVLYV